MAWILSIVLGIAVVRVFFVGSSESAAWLFIFLLGAFLGFIFKGMFLGEEFIQETVLNYTNKVLQMVGERLGKGALVSEVKKETVQPEMKETIYQPTVSKSVEESWEEQTIRESQNEGIMKNTKIEQEDEYIAPTVQKEPEIQEPSFIEKFFAENALAKIGGILLFLGVLFFLSLIFTALGPVGKIIIGFMTGFTFFGIGVWLDTKEYNNESRTMMGVGILVNYLVILSGRYLIGDGSSIVATDVAVVSGNINYLTEGTTFFFLILNTIFAIVASLVYKSHSLLLFSFAFAYLNPFLIGSVGDGTPYTLVGYSAIISIGAFVLSQLYHNKDEKDFAKYLRFVGFIGGNILFLLAPFTTSGQWLLKLIFLGIVSLAAIVLTYKNEEDTETIGTFFILTYVAFGILLITGGVANILHTGLAFLGYIAFILIALATTAFIILVGSVASLGYLLFAPLILIFALLITGSLYFIIPVILGSLFIYLIIFGFLYEVISAGFKYLFFVLLCIFLALSHFSLGFVMPEGMDYMTRFGVVINSFVFLFASYFFSRREKLEYLYTIGTIGTIFLLLPIIQTQGEFMTVSVISLVLFPLANILAPFINRNLCQKDLKNLAISLIVGILFIGGELYNYGEIAKLFPGMILGYSFMGLAILYFILGYAMTNVLEIGLNPTGLMKNEEKKNAIFGYLGVSLSLFSIAILVIFASEPAVVASIWFFEATLLLFFYSRIQDIKIFLGGLVLFIIGIVKYSVFITSLETGIYMQLIPLVAIFISFILNLKFLDKIDGETRIAHDILHLIAMIMVGIGVMNIVPHTGQGISIFAMSIVFVIVGFCYNLYASQFLKYAFVGFLGLFYINHIFGLSDIFWTLTDNNKTHLKSLQYIIVLLLGVGLYLRNLKPGKFDDMKIFLNIPYIVYLFIITTQFVYDLSDKSIFSITIYWSLWAFVYIFNGISKDNQTRRTIGLYILAGVILKILLYDVWFGINDAILRVVALMFVGGLMIYISTLYSRKYPGNLLKEFSLTNLNNQSSVSVVKDNTEKDALLEEKTSLVINEKISEMDIGDITLVTFTMNSGKSLKIKSKNLIKIAKLVERKMGKSVFEKEELKDIHHYILDNYRSELSAADYKKVTDIMKEFIEVGGKVSFE
ncbi:hypothetical protein AUK10_02105 [Candidatus Gracilibacteria bacterium CG2_30_37_12]|nr:MAG: hypothetical protein AUK10_02105 [Candidatus Gracilibacteria bacterium CG2_30_37_12]